MSFQRERKRPEESRRHSILRDPSRRFRSPRDDHTLAAMSMRPLMLLLTAAAALFPVSRPLRAAAADAWPKVPAVDWSTIKLDDFSDDELDLPYFLHHFHTVANAVVESGSNR